MGAVQVPTQQTPNELTVARCRGPKKPALKTLTCKSNNDATHVQNKIKKIEKIQTKGGRAGEKNAGFLGHFLGELY